MIAQSTKILFGLLISCAFSAAQAIDDSSIQFLSRANAKVAKAAALKTRWDGPTSGPKLVADKKVVFIAADLRDAGTYGVLNGLREAAAVANWQILPMDCRGQCAKASTIIKQALELKPDAIILAGVDAGTQTQGMVLADAAKVPVVGWHASPTPGPTEGLFTNVTGNYKEAAQIAALYGVVESDTKAGIVIFTDNSNPYLAAKSREVVDTIKQCDSCRLLSVEEMPFATAASRMQGSIEGLIKKNGAKWTHIIVINDYYLDLIEKPAVTALIARNNLRALSAGDGSTTAYKRIRANSLQIGTVPEPLILHGYQLMDEINRAINKAPASGYVAQTHLVTNQNIAYDGGPKNGFDPSNDYRGRYRQIWGK